MPEKHLSFEELKNLYSWLTVQEIDGKAKELGADNPMSSYFVGETKEPLIIVEDVAGVSGPFGKVEADIYYSAELESKLAEAGVIFEKG